MTTGTGIAGAMSYEPRETSDAPTRSPAEEWQWMVERIRALEDGLEPFAEAWDVATHHKDVVARLTMAQLGELAAHEVSGVHFRNAHAALTNTDKREP